MSIMTAETPRAATALSKPMLKVVQRYESEEIRACALAQGRDVELVAAEYRKVRTILGGILNGHADSAVKRIVDPRLKAHLDQLFEMLDNTPDIPSEGVAELRAVIAKVINPTVQKAMGDPITVEHIRTFLTIIDQIRERYRFARYNASEVITPELYALGQMVAADFETYDATING